MLYKHSHCAALSRETFKNPPSEYRGAPFWAWNDRLTEEELTRQIDVFREMGLGGYHMHVRTGLKTPYLGNEFMDLVDACVKKAEKENMYAYLYDEDRWPSGAAGGLVTADERYRARCLLFTNALYGEETVTGDSCSEGGRTNKGTLLACYDVALDETGALRGYRRIGENDEAAGQKWYAILEIHHPSAWYNDKTYADTLNPDAIRRFVEVTHEKYKEKVGYAFGNAVPSIFTDEPQFTRKTVLGNSLPDGDVDVLIPWTDAVPEKYQKAYGADVFETLPELFWERADGKPSLARWRYHDFIAELFASSFADVVGGWCEQNGIALTGHMMEEPSLRSQTAALGEAMRSYRSFGIPGIDMLCNSHEFTTAKQAESARRQFGREGVLSELYGVTGWDADFRLYKHQGDWQACLGVTLRVPHLSWYSMQGEAKRDYPASISYQSAWYKEYSAVEDHFARVNAALTRGKARVKVAMIHPVESFWLHFGPDDKTKRVREDLDARFKDLTTWLLTGGVDFDYVSESLLPTLCGRGGNPLRVGEMAYDAVIVPALETIRHTTLERLAAFAEAGGKLVVLDAYPTLVDASPSDEPARLFAGIKPIPFSRGAVLDALECVREISLGDKRGRPADDLLYTMRDDGDGRWLFIAHANEPRNKDVDGARDLRIRLKGEFVPELWDTSDGSVKNLPAEYINGDTRIDLKFFPYDSLLLRLTPGRSAAEANTEVDRRTDRVEIRRPAGFTIGEENVLLLDEAFYALDDAPYSLKKEEILRLDNICREQLGWDERGGHIVQPWVYGEQPADHKLHLMFAFDSEIEADACLALEDAADAEIVLNGDAVAPDVKGNFVDISIGKVALPGVKRGTNILEVTLPFGKSRGAEAMYLLGRFGVRLTGEDACLIPFPENVGFGDLTTQGFPFYGSTVTYRFKVVAKNGRMTLRASDYAGALITVEVDGERRGRIIYPPYELALDGLSDGVHDVSLTVWLSRQNTFGDVHNVDESARWYGPGAWRTEDESWSYGYVLRRVGLLKAPEIETPTD
ncbi:MAG: hypothetical protein IK104_00290 [Clostridia bacterium]|nr:hypothetical protein [Clostridia bacterium]